MNKFLAKIRTASFWAEAVGAIMLILPHLGIDVSAVADKIISAIGSVMLAFGIVVSPISEAEKSAPAENPVDDDLPHDDNPDNEQNKQ